MITHSNSNGSSCPRSNSKKMSQSEPTEWDLIQARMGNRPAPKPKEAGAASKYRDEEELEQETAFKKWESAVLEKFDELEELDDENVLLAFREKRLAELQAKAARARFGELIEIHEPDYVAEVTSQRDIFVVVFLFKVGVPRCDILEAYLRPVAAKYKSTKFVKIRSESVSIVYCPVNIVLISHAITGDPRLSGQQPADAADLSQQRYCCSNRWPRAVWWRGFAPRRCGVGAA